MLKSDEIRLHESSEHTISAYFLNGNYLSAGAESKGSQRLPNAPKGRKYEPGGFIARYVNRLSKRKSVDRRNRRLAQGKCPPRPSLKMPNGKGKEGYCEYTASKV